VNYNRELRDIGTTVVEVPDEVRAMFAANKSRN
jgi:hypothetical protein